MIVIKMSNGSVAVMVLLGIAAETAAAAPEHLDTVVQTEISQWADETMRAAVVSWREMPDEAIPPDPMFAPAWRDETPDLVIDFDMTVCREIWRNKMRAARQPKLAALDIAFQRALEANADTAAIVAQKQALRDCTADPAIEAAQTVDDLKKVWPQVLD